MNENVATRVLLAAFAAFRVLTDPEVAKGLRNARVGIDHFQGAVKILRGIPEAQQLRTTTFGAFATRAFVKVTKNKPIAEDLVVMNYGIETYDRAWRTIGEYLRSYGGQDANAGVLREVITPHVHAFVLGAFIEHRSAIMEHMSKGQTKQTVRMSEQFFLIGREYGKLMGKFTIDHAQGVKEEPVSFATEHGITVVSVQQNHDSPAETALNNSVAEALLTKRAGDA